MTIGDRLREERERLGFAQPAFAALADTTKKSQIDYEKDVTQPKAGYLAAISKVGADVQYIVTGVRSVAALTNDEAELLERFRAASLEVKAAAIGALKGGTSSKGESSRSSTKERKAQRIEGSMQVFHKAPKGDIAGRDINKRK
ncbi:helix-turn-helix domain-containing protein [Paraburkholderia sp. BR14263]|uniref:helix-turn-helix domain-containing protein n=1 Tax=unclassified Paraburkholderia TaxID=2615204 RepID=UPI0034CFFA25